MELYRTVRMNLANCFYYPNQKRIFGTKRLLAIFLEVLAMISILFFILLEAENAMDYVTAGFLFVPAFGILISFIDTTIKTTKIFAMVDTSVKTIEKSEH